MWTVQIKRFNMVYVETKRKPLSPPDFVTKVVSAVWQTPCAPPPLGVAVGTGRPLQVQKIIINSYRPSKFPSLIVKNKRMKKNTQIFFVVTYRAWFGTVHPTILLSMHSHRGTSCYTNSMPTVSQQASEDTETLN